WNHFIAAKRLLAAMRGPELRVIERRDERPVSVGGSRERRARGGVVEARAAEQRADGSGARALGTGRSSAVAFGTRIFVIVCVLRRRIEDERGHGWTARDGRTGVSTVSRCLRARGSSGIALMRVVCARAAPERAERD